MSNRRSFGAMLLALCAGAACSATMPDSQDKEDVTEDSLRVLRQINHVLGPHNSAARILRTQEDLQKTRMNFRPKVDFETESAVLVALGWRSSTGYGVWITKLKLEGKVLHVYAKQRSPGGIAGAFPTQPYSLAVVPKLPKDVTIQLHGVRLSPVRRVKKIDGKPIKQPGFPFKGGDKPRLKK